MDSLIKHKQAGCVELAFLSYIAHGYYGLSYIEREIIDAFLFGDS